MVELRVARAADSAAAWAILRDAVGAAAPYTPAQRRAWVPDAAEPAWMAARLAAGTGWIAGRAGRAEGLLVATGEASVHLDLFFLRSEARASGVGSALLAAFDAHAGARPCTAFASLCLRPILVARGWRVVRADPVARGDQTLLRFAMTLRGGAAAALGGAGRSPTCPP